MSHTRFRVKLHMYLDMHGLIFEMTTSIRQDQSDICSKENKYQIDKKKYINIL